MAKEIRFNFVGDPSDLIQAFRDVQKAADDVDESVTKNESTWDKLDKRVIGVSSQISDLVGVYGKYVAAVGAAAGAMALLSSKTAEADRQLGDFAARLGTDVETLSGLRYAASTVGLEFEDLEDGARTLAEAMAEAARGGTSEAVESLNRLGVAGTDVIAGLETVADQFSQMEDGAEKTAMAMKLFGSEVGVRMIPLLNQGSAGIAELREEAARFGATVREEDVAAANEFQGALAELKAQSGALASEFGRAMLPRLIDIATATAEVVRWFTKWAGLSRETDSALAVRVERLDRYALNLRLAEEELAVLLESERLLAEQDIIEPTQQARIAELNDAVAKWGGLMEAAREEQRRFRVDIDLVGEDGERVYGDLLPAAIGKSIEVVDTFISKEQKLLAAQKAAAEERIAQAEEEARRVAELEADKLARREEAIEAEGEMRRRRAEEEREERIEMRDNAFAIAQEIGDFLIQVNQEVQQRRLEAVRAIGSKIDATEEALAQATTQRERTLLRNRLDALREQDAEATRLAREEWRRGQGLAIATTIINTAMAITQALANVAPPASYVLAAVNGAMGLAQTIAIAAQPAPFHSGGMVRDEVMIRARSGEGILSPQGVESVGGPQAVADINAGQGRGGAPIVIVQKLDHQVFNAQVTRALQRSGSSLSAALRTTQPRSIGRSNPYART